MSMQNTTTRQHPFGVSRVLRHPFGATVLLAALATATAARAQDTRPVAFTNATIHTVSGPVIERGTLVVRNGKIDAVGADVTVPAGARIVDASGMTILPGLVSAWSQAGLAAPQTRSSMPQRGGRRSRGRMRPSTAGRTTNEAATKAADALYARQDVFGELLSAGVTSLALNPLGYGFPGLGAVLDPSGTTRTELTLDDDAFVQIGMQRDANAKKLLKETFEKAKEVVAEREKPKEEPKPEPKEGDKKDEAKEGQAKPAEGEQPKPGEGPKPGDEPKPEKDKEQGGKEQGGKEQGGEQKPAEQKPKPKPKDPKLEVLADLLQGKRRAMLQIDSAADMLHWQSIVDDDVTFPRTVVVTRHDSNSGTIDLVLDQLKEWKCSVLLPPSLTTKPRSYHLDNVAKTLHDGGIEIGFAVGDSQQEVRRLFFQLMELTRSGLPADVALKAVTLVPAKMLGIDKRTGSLEVGKDADLLVFDGDPLAPTGRLAQVWLRGKRVETETDRQQSRPQ